jgi:hypothetical protein
MFKARLKDKFESKYNVISDKDFGYILRQILGLRFDSNF